MLLNEDQIKITEDGLIARQTEILKGFELWYRQPRTYLQSYSRSSEVNYSGGQKPIMEAMEEFVRLGNLREEIRKVLESVKKVEGAKK